MKKLNGFKIVQLVLILIFAALSFAPCIEKATEYIQTGSREPFECYTVDSMNYLPLFCCAVSVAEIVLLLVNERRVGKIAAFISAVAVTFLPIHIRELGEELFSVCGGLVSGVDYSYSIWGYVILAVGCLSAMLYAFDIVSSFRKKSDVKN